MSYMLNPVTRDRSVTGDHRTICTWHMPARFIEGDNRRARRGAYQRAP